MHACVNLLNWTPICWKLAGWTAAGWLVLAEVSHAADSFEQDIRPLLTEFCCGCHQGEDPQGELDLAHLQSQADVDGEPNVLEGLLEQVELGQMPPKDEQQMTAEQRQRLQAWAVGTLDRIALANAGDPGPVALRRLSNMEYTYSIRDLTGLSEFDPVREFPVDGAAGEGFTNASAALVMSPTLLTKYLDAAKELAAHAVLTPTGIHFSESTSDRDWTNETLASIREFYSRFSADDGATAVDLQGIRFDTNSGGRLPVELYMAELSAARDQLLGGEQTIEQLAAASGLNAKYLGLLWGFLAEPIHAPELSSARVPVLDDVRTLFHAASPNDANQVVDAIRAWQTAMWRFTSVGHIGKVDGPEAWQEPVSSLRHQHEMRLPLAANQSNGDLLVYLSVSNAGDGSNEDFAVWDNARIVADGRPDILLSSVRDTFAKLDLRRQFVAERVTVCLAAAAQAMQLDNQRSMDELAQAFDVPPRLLEGWLKILGVGERLPPQMGPLITEKMYRTPESDSVSGWAGPDALSVLANASDAEVRVPGTIRPLGIAVHPSPTTAVVIGWRSPVQGSFTITGKLQDSHITCGNGFAWELQLRRGTIRSRLAGGVSQGDAPIEINVTQGVQLYKGSFIALVISARDSNHFCDLTSVDLQISDAATNWDLAKDVGPQILAGNPHADRFGNADVWFFAGEVPNPQTNAVAADPKPEDPLLDQWIVAESPADRRDLAERLQNLFVGAYKELAPDAPDRRLAEQFMSWDSPLLSTVLDEDLEGLERPSAELSPGELPSAGIQYGLDASAFGGAIVQGTTSQGTPQVPATGELRREGESSASGQTASGSPPRDIKFEENVSSSGIYVRAPSLIEVRLPAELLDAGELVATGRLVASSQLGSVQMQLSGSPPEQSDGLLTSRSENELISGHWLYQNLETRVDLPIIANEDSPAWRRFDEAFDAFRNLFPAALCYTKIVPVDEVVTLRLFYREDEFLKRLMLSDSEQQELDRLWGELLFVSRAPLKQVDVFEQLYQYATQDADPTAFAPLREPILKQAEVFQQNLIAAEPNHVQAVINLAEIAWRRPILPSEIASMRQLLARLRADGIGHEAAVRSLLVRVLVSPAFLYRGEAHAKGPTAAKINDWELATRLSFFLWSSHPDEDLRRLAAAGKLGDPDVLSAQIARMLQDEKVRRLALEFGCQWLHVRDVATLDEKSERHFPTFATLRGDMQEEAVQFFVDLFQNNRSVLNLLNADYTFVNASLAEHYGFDPPQEAWQRIEGVQAAGRGGVLAFASTLAKHSGASRTSPILRGNWLSEVILGEKLPKPPKDVPLLPNEPAEGLTERQLIERHSSDPSCATCHRRIDPLGFALEGFDAIGRRRSTDAAGLNIDTNTVLDDGTQLSGLDGLRSYLVDERRDDFARQFLRKLVGFALGRSVQLSDKPLMDSILADWESHDYAIGEAIERIVRSPQFRQVRGSRQF